MGNDVMYQSPRYIQERQQVPSADWMLDWYLAAHRAWWNNWEQAPENRTWRASSLGYCLRKQTLQRLGIPSTTTMDAKTIRTFAWGDEVHSFIRKVFWRLGLVVAEEPTFTDEDRHITGHVDLIWSPAGFARPMPEHWSDEWVDYVAWLRNEFHATVARMYDGGAIPDEPFGAEIKSAHSNAMKRLMTEGPYAWHRTQAGIYKHMAKTTPPFEVTGVVTSPTPLLFHPVQVDRWHIMYVGKDSTGMLMFEVEDAWVDDALARLDDLNRYWAADMWPPCTCEGWWVGSCDYNEGQTCCGRELRGRVAKEMRTAERGQ